VCCCCCVAVVVAVHRRDTETEVLAFSANAGTANIQILVSPYSRTNLRMNLQVQDANFAVLSDQTGAGIAAFTLALPQTGTYYLLIKGAGLGDLTTGYSNYGSRGQYEVVATYSTGPAPPPPSPSPSPAVSMPGAKQRYKCNCDRPLFRPKQHIDDVPGALVLCSSHYAWLRLIDGDDAINETQCMVNMEHMACMGCPVPDLT
jgi:hypothetical protein